MGRYARLYSSSGKRRAGGAAGRLFGDGTQLRPGQNSTLTPGKTTLEEASRALTAPPDKYYKQTDGTFPALWSFKITFVPDGFYSRKEALLQFGPDGRLLRLVDSTNILLEPWERQKLLGPAPPPEDNPSRLPRRRPRCKRSRYRCPGAARARAQERGRQVLTFHG